MKRRNFLSLIAAAPALAAKPRESAFPNWSSEEVDQILTKSAWAHEWKRTIEIPAPVRHDMSFAQIGGVQLPSPIPGIGGGWPGSGRRNPQSGSRLPYPGSGGNTGGTGAYHTEVRLIARWASALPVRRAMALHEFGRDGLKQERALALLNEKPEEYRLELTGIPRRITGGDAEDIEKALMKSASLYFPGHRPIRPKEVSVPSPGATVTARMQFPRWTDINADGGEVEFSADLGTIHIKEAFKLRLMQYEGSLEL